MNNNASLLSVLFDGVTLALAFVFLLLLLWHDWRKRQTQTLAIFLFVLMAWNAGLMLIRASFLAGQSATSLFVGIALIEGGIAASNVAFYAFISTLAGNRSPRLIRVSAISITAVVAMRLAFSLWIWSSDSFVNIVQQPRVDGLPIMFYLFYAGMALNTLYSQRRKITSGFVRAGSFLFATGQFLALVNTNVGISSLATNASTLGALLIVLSIVDAEMIRPLAERDRQVATLHKVGQEIAGQPRLIPVLEEIARQAAEWVGGDAGGIFLRHEDQLVLVAGHNLPLSYIGHKLSLEAGIAGLVSRTGRAQRVENYKSDWIGIQPDFPHAFIAFGSMIAVPIVSRDQVSGVLIAVTGTQGRLLRADDVYRLELLAPQAALVIGYTGLLDLKTSLAETIEDNRQQLETVLVSTESPVIAVNRRMRLIFANPAANLILGLGDAQVGDEIMTKLPVEMFPPNLRTLAQDLKTSNGHIFEVILNSRTYQSHLARLGRLRGGGWVAVLNDVTQLKELDRMKGEMIRMVSHDLKNPLMAAMLQIDLIRYRNGGESSESVDIMERQMERMNRIIRGVLDVERLRSGSLRLTPAYVAPIIEKAVDDLRRLAEEAGISVDYEASDELIILCDEDHVERAISNLVENAIKFTPRDGSVSVRSVAQEESVIVIVKDSGVGIPEETQPKIFQRFFRGQQRGFEYATGTGLGLALVRAIMDNHKGLVWFESREGEGTTFYLRFQRVEELPDLF